MYLLKVHRNTRGNRAKTMLGRIVLTSAVASSRTFAGLSRGRALSSASTMDATDRDSVLSFWFGPEWQTSRMERDEYLKSSVRRWFMGGKEMDEQAQQLCR